MRLAKHFLGLAALAMFGAAAAQDYPAKPIRAIVPFPPGGVVDIVARTVGQKMSEGLGQALVIENRGGAGGSIGTDVAAKAPADGYNVLFAFDTHAVNPHIYKTIRFDTLKDFAPVALIVNIPLVVAALPSFPASSMKELVDLAKAKPGAYSYASVGAGSSGHLATEQFKLLTGIDLVHVPYKGGAPAVTDLLGGQVNLAVIAAGAAVPHLRAGRLKGLAVSGAQRSGAMPNVPTMAEAGYPQLQSGAWVGLLVPAGTPAPVIARLNAEVLKAIKDPALVAKLAEQSIEVAGSTPEQFGAFIRAEHEKWGKLIKDARLNIEQ
jgi:tripartite-type tricarboxylate transporter receptor subunit TctC